MGIGLGLALPFAQRRILGAAELLDNVIDIIGANEGAIFDVAAAFERGAIWEDSARTTPASVDGPVGSIQDELLRYYAEQATGAAKPILRAGDGKMWLEGDGTKWLSTSIATPVDDVFAVAAVRRLDTATSEFFSNRNNAGSDSEGQWALQTTGSGWRFVYRQAGSNPGVSVSSELGVTSVVDGRYTASNTTAVIALNGVDGSSVVAEKIGTNLTLALLARNPFGATPINGRLYHAAMVGAALSAPQRALFRQLAALRAGVVLP